MPTAMIVILVLLLLMVIASSIIRRRAAAIRAADAMRDLRLQMLRTTPDDLELTVAPNEPFTIVMDMAYPNAVVSVVAAATGDASLYFSTGGGVLGGIQHESVRVAATAFLETAKRRLDQLSPTNDFPFPAVGQVRFYVGTPEGTREAEASEQELAEGRHALSPLYVAGHNVITTLREATERQQRS